MTSIQKNVQQAKATGDDKRYGQVASRKKVRQSTSPNVYPHIFFRNWKEWVWNVSKMENDTKRAIMGFTMRL